MKVLIVEDELLIGMDLVMLLQEWGYETSGPHRTPKAALSAVAAEKPDLAILDVNLGDGQTSLPIADLLEDAGTPFLFLTGYDPSRYSASDMIDRAPHLRKPITESALRGLLDEMSSRVE